MPFTQAMSLNDTLPRTFSSRKTPSKVYTFTNEGLLQSSNRRRFFLSMVKSRIFVYSPGPCPFSPIFLINLPSLPNTNNPTFPWIRLLNGKRKVPHPWKSRWYLSVCCQPQCGQKWACAFHSRVCSQRQLYRLGNGNTDLDSCRNDYSSP